MTSRQEKLLNLNADLAGNALSFYFQEKGKLSGLAEALMIATEGTGMEHDAKDIIYTCCPEYFGEK